MKAFEAILAAALSTVLLFEPATGDALMVLGKNTSLKGTVIVSPGATEAESGALLLEALASASGSADTPYLIKIEPGTYDLSGSTLFMKPYVDIEGSGPGVTVILSANDYQGVVRGCSNAEIRDLSVVNTIEGENTGFGISATDSIALTIRNAGIEVSGGCRWPYGVSAHNSDMTIIGVTVRVISLKQAYGIMVFEGELRLRDVQSEAATVDALSNVYAIRIDSAGSQSSPVLLENVRATASGGYFTVGLDIRNSTAAVKKVDCLAQNGDQNRGIYIASCTQPVTITKSRAEAIGGSTATAIGVEDSPAVFSGVSAKGQAGSGASNGLYAIGADNPHTITIDHSQLAGSSYSVGCSDLDYTFLVGASKLDGAVSGVGTWRCVHAYNGDYHALDSSCQPF